MDNEEFYDSEIAPQLAELAKKCEARSIAFIAAVEYKHGEIGETRVLPDGTGLAMIMLAYCVKMGLNIDGYMMALQQYMNRHGMDCSASLYMSRFEKNIPINK
jgi:hypothetical protein